MPKYSQAGRPVRVDTELGPDVLLLLGFNGTEALSKPFTFQLELLSETDDIAPESLLRTPVVLSVLQHDGTERKIHGLVRSFGQLGQHEKLISYRAEIVPWFWFLSLSQDCRVFQDMSVIEIVEDIFTGFGYKDFEVRCARSYVKREYCVQYRESHCDFVSRLLEEEGIFYHFEHTEDGHTLVLADSNGVLDPCPGPEEVAMRSGPLSSEDHIATMEREHAVCSGTAALTDYDYLQPPRSLDAELSGSGQGEVFDYQPARYSEQDRGERFARILLEQREAQRHVVFGRGSCRHFQAGFTFELTGHYRDDMNRTYLLVQVGHAVRAGSYTTWDSPRLDHDVSFVAIPDDIPFRPQPTTARPLVHGSQTAEVVGKADEEIWTDEHGRIKVQFHWDRYGELNEHSSCWVRVASRWAGKGWGEIHIPRIGQEVVVDFLEGNPDRPLVTGAVYNADHPPPWDLPTNQTRSGVKSRSSKGGGGWNEISIDDRKGSEEVTIHAQKNMNTAVVNDQSTTVGNDQSNTVGNNQSISVGADRSISVAGSRSETVSGDTSLTIADGDRTQTVASGRSDEYVKGDRSVTVDGASAHTIKGDASIRVTDGDLTLKTDSGKIVADGKAGVHLTSTSDISLKGKNVSTRGDIEVSVDGTTIKLTGKTEITLGVGANFVKIDPTGVTIFGTIVKIN